MKTYNTILLQLNKAIESANSRYPQEKAIAVILFDNLIEQQLYRIASNNLLWEEAWSLDRTMNTQTRSNIIGEKGKYERLLKFAKDIEVITESELEIIKFVHDIRNAVYHRGEYDDHTLSVALLIYYGIVKSKLKTWARDRHLTTITGGAAYEYIDFGQGLNPAEHPVLRDHEKYFNDALAFLLSKWSISAKLDEKVIEMFQWQLRKIHSALLYVRTTSTELNFYKALWRYTHLVEDFDKYAKADRKPKNLDSVMLLALFVREHKDELADISDRKVRKSKARSLLKRQGAIYKSKYPHWQDLKRIEDRVTGLKGKSEHYIVKNIISIQNTLSALYLDLQEAASILSDYEQELWDQYRDK